MYLEVGEDHGRSSDIEAEAEYTLEDAWEDWRDSNGYR